MKYSNDTSCSRLFSNANYETEMLDCSNLIPGSFGLSSEM